jgi:hypothetical protein
MIHQPRQQLHRDVLERQRRAVKQLQHELIGRRLIERRDSRMAEGRVSIIGHARQISIRDLATDEGPNHFRRNLGIGTTEKSGDRLRRQLRPGFRHIESAIARKPRQHDIAKAERRCLAPRRNILHRTSSKGCDSTPSL